ncbi:toxin-antitoxin system YwqK family antitoxin [Jiulongibacter sediminis]|uniref:toxin-antitoxin system YwqK family antitoxin n=1 Tax=Jiulongibacter sediminis TaxID=1605367 RepID=UPI0026E92590|nr:toxin-antitoxin system YwqK family antitoxin [Jiulongibacter sediminis]
MRIFLFIILASLLGFSKSEITENQVSGSDSRLKKAKGILYLNQKAFSGYLVTYSNDGQLISKTGYLNGKLEGVSQKWTAEGQLTEERNYHQNQRTGRHVGYFENGQKRFEYYFNRGLPIETHKEWLEDGQLYSISNYNAKGQPEGEQKLYFPSGKIRANYVVKNGRRYGLLGAKGCMGENERRGAGFLMRGV